MPFQVKGAATTIFRFRELPRELPPRDVQTVRDCYNPPACNDHRMIDLTADSFEFFSRVRAWLGNPEKLRNLV